MAEALLQQQWVVQHHAKTVNYDYWRRLTIVEKDQLAVDAHRHVYLGKKLFREGRTSPRGENGDQPSEAREELEKGMAALAKIFEQYPQLAEDSLVEEGLTAVQYWLYIHQLNGIEPPTEYPLKAVWEKPENQQMRVTVRERFRTENSLEQ